MFTFSGLRSGLLLEFENQILRCAPSRPRRAPLHSCWRCEWKHNGRALLSLCIRAASALPLLCSTRAVWNQALLKRSHLISEIFLLLQCAAAGSARAFEQADHALAQVRPHHTFFSLALNGGGRIFLAPHPLPFFPPCLLSCLVSYRNTWETLSALLLKTSKLKNHGFDQLVSQRNWHHLLDEKHGLGGA